REALYRMIGDAFFPGASGYGAEEIPSDGEVKTADELKVDLPPDNLDFHALALALSTKLPRDPEIPEGAEARAAWARARRRLLREIVRAKDSRIEALPEESVEGDGARATFWSLFAGEAWTVPAVEITRGEPKKTAILLADGGRASAAARADELLAAGCRVLAVDPFYFGESAIRERAYLYALLVSSIGDRPLGIQASQIAAIARWLASERGADPVTVIAEGPRTGLIALVAAALEDKAIAGVETRGALGSLREVIEKDWTVDEKPELFCFGLLESFDIPQLAALVAPRPAIAR
ncbi:MAG: hypothetical protein JXP34_25205, partial [Planctomycetes bacterium]|nr:hypothetical protein [Planctomycetota bacterium]